MLFVGCSKITRVAGQVRRAAVARGGHLEGRSLTSTSIHCASLLYGIDERYQHLWFYHVTLCVGSVCGTPAARTAPPAFDVRLSGLLCGRPDDLELDHYHTVLHVPSTIFVAI